jgi:diaminopimelate epimerase
VQLDGDVATVEMGRVVVKRLGQRDADVDVGNPHLVVLVDDPSTVDLLALGTAHADVNVEVIAPVGTDELAFRVHERGAGITMACGTGSCAAVAAAHAWGLVGSSVRVHNPGGDVTVELHDEEALLTGPTVFIADIEVPWH